LAGLDENQHHDDPQDHSGHIEYPLGGSGQWDCLGTLSGHSCAQQ
jgi:hypothetical protein